MKKLFISILTALATITSVAETPLWLRDAAISPDGKTVAFTYKGDIFTVPVSGGKARQITTNDAYDSKPLWTPNGEKLVFNSTREGSTDIFICDAAGGNVRRLTTHSGSETPLGFNPEGLLMFSANIQPSQSAIQGPFQTQLYSLDINRENARPEMVYSLQVRSLSYNADGDMLYEDKKGYEDPLRKHEHSSGTSDIWLVREGKFTKLTDFNGHDLNPVWAPDGKKFYYISEEDGTLNIYSSNSDGRKTKLTNFTKHPVRSLSAANDGRLAFSWDGEIYTISEGEAPRKVDIEIIGDDYDSDIVKNIRRSGATTMAVSPSGDEVAFIIRGDIYVTSTKYKTTKRITDTPAQERCVEFSPDGRTLVYDSDRDGVWQLFTAKIANDDEKQFAYASEIVEEPLYSCATSAQQPVFSPDGKKVAFLENRTELRVIDVDSKQVNTALDGKFNYSYSDGDITFEWSPDSRWLLADYIGVGGWNNSDIALVCADGSEVIDLTESGYSDGNPKWALGGKALTYSTGRYGMRSHGSWGNTSDIVLMVLDGEAWDEFNMTEEEADLAEKAKDDKKDNDSDDKATKKGIEPLSFDLDNRKYRMRRLTSASSSLGDYYLSPKGDKLYYSAAATEGGRNLLVHDLKKGETKVLLKGISGGFAADKDGKNLFVISGGGMKKIDLAAADSKPIEFEATYDRKPSKEREYIYNHAWKQVKDKFYDANLHGVDWDYYGEHYRRFLPYINNNYDFAILLSELLGELNASHTGGRYYAPGASMPTAELGAFFDPTYSGNGLRISEILPRGPLSSAKFNLKPGDIITAIDGETIEAGKDYYPLLEGKAGKKTALTVKRDGGKTDRIEVTPTGSIRDLLYTRWVERNQAIVDSLSDGRIGYVHVSGMDSPSFRTVFDEMLGKYRNREAIIVDTRWNGGGWLHNDLAILLGGKEYVRFVPRGQYIGSEPFSQWNKPSVMLVNESNYSDAHGSPFVYQTLGLGDVVGAPVPGTMTAVWWETQIDPSLVFGIPQVTSMDMDGNVLENRQLNPDVLIYNRPDDVMNGIDDQIAGSVRTLLEKIDKK
ncbi:MAG: PDZ domain-containing protein [Muribaculaceae bacterium]|nr:PDZ domain-containing protein [Muribaculaceae bacterium]